MMNLDDILRARAEFEDLKRRVEQLERLCSYLKRQIENAH